MKTLREILTESKERMDLQYNMKSINYLVIRLKDTFKDSLKSEDFLNSINRVELDKKLKQLDDALEGIKEIIEKSK